MTAPAPVPTTPATTGPVAASRVRAAWVELLDAILQGCPPPLSVSVAQDGGYASMSMTQDAHVQEWARFLNLSTPHGFDCLSEDGTRRLTSFSASGHVAHDTPVSVYHVVTAPADPQDRQNVDATTAGEPDA